MELKYSEDIIMNAIRELVSEVEITKLSLGFFGSQ